MSGEQSATELASVADVAPGAVDSPAPAADDFKASVPPTKFVTRSQRKDAPARAHSDPMAMLLGASITFGLSLVPRLARGIFRGANKRAAAAKDAAAVTPEKLGGLKMGSLAFGSPVNPSTPTSKQGPATDLTLASIPEFDSKRDQETPCMALPPGQIKMQLQVLKDIEAENARLKGFVESYMKDSEKVKTLQKENEALMLLKEKLEEELCDVQTKFNAVANNGEELSRFKLSMHVPLEARSVYSDVDANKRDTNRLDSSMSMAGLQRKNPGGIQAIMKWASGTTRATTSAAPSLPSSPRGAGALSSSVQQSEDAANVVGLFDMFAQGGRF